MILGTEYTVKFRETLNFSSATKNLVVISATIYDSRSRLKYATSKIQDPIKRSAVSSNILPSKESNFAT